METKTGIIPQVTIKRTLTVEISRDPPISGYGGWDEWTLEDMTTEEIDNFLGALDILCGNYRGRCYTGSS